MGSDTILTEASAESLALAVEDSAGALFRQMAGALGGDLDETGELIRYSAFPDNVMFRGVVHSRLTTDDTEDAITETIDWFQSRNVSSFLWWTDTSTMPYDLGHRLIARGFVSRGTEDGLLASNRPANDQGSPVMTADMRRFDQGVLKKTPPGFRISEVQTEADLLGFQRVFAASHDVPESAAQAWGDASRHAGIRKTPWRIYVGWLNDEPVACNVVVTGGGIASVWAIGTIPSARGKGIGAAITIVPLLDAFNAGYRYAGLFASEMGAPVYERIGFTYTGTRINRYLWRSPA